MRLILSILTGLFVLLAAAACKPAPFPAEDDARRITDPQEWGRSLGK